MDEEISYLIQKGKKAFEGNDYEKALECFLDVIKRRPRYADIHNYLGLIYHSKGKFDLAIEHFKKALEINPNYTEAALNLAVIYNDTGQYNKSKQIQEIVKRAYAPDPLSDQFFKGKLANMYANIGNIFMDMGHYEEAIEEYKKALQYCPQFSDIRTKLGIAYRNLGHFEEAIREFEEAKRYKPNYIPAMLNLGIIYFSLNEFEKAANEWKSVLNIDPQNKLANLYLKLIERKGDSD